ncbi:MAG: PrsW family intramembrane metalloprotease [Spirochaetes bacterium]|nr:PrsW family intramembrane metalloprotease [Spirochaetota bacterium]
MKDFLLKIVLPAVLVISIVNLFFDRPDSNKPEDVIKKARASGNHEIVRKQLEQLIKNDFFNLEHHRDYLRSCLRLAKNNDISNESDAVRNDYIKYSLDNDPNISDVGYYGLGFYYAIRDDYQNSLDYYNKVRDKEMSFLNNSIGFVYLNLGEDEKAKGYFYREIKCNGNIEGAYSNLSEIFYKERDFDKLNQFVSDDGIKNYIPNRITRITYLINGHFLRYISNCFNYDFITSSGFIAALLVLIVWFQYLRKIDVFEPERTVYLLLTLISGMFFAELCTFLYDFFDYSLSFKINGKIINDLFYCVFGIGFIEETVKIIPFLLMLRFSRQINESIDYIIYASVSALGFAFMENLMYFQDPGLKSITGRTLMSVLLHMSASTFAIYGIFYSKYRKRNQHKILYFAAWFAIAIIAHGLYDFWLIAEKLPPQFKIFSVLVLAVCVNKFSIIIRNALNKSEFNTEKKTRIENLSKHLVYSISAIILLQYVLMAWKFGAQNANESMLKAIFLYYFLILIIISNLGKIEITKSKWIPFFTKKKRKAMVGRS